MHTLSTRAIAAVVYVVSFKQVNETAVLWRRFLATYKLVNNALGKSAQHERLSWSEAEIREHPVIRISYKECYRCDVT